MRTDTQTQKIHSSDTRTRVLSTSPGLTVPGPRKARASPPETKCFSPSLPLSESFQLKQTAPAEALCWHLRSHVPVTSSKPGKDLRRDSSYTRTLNAVSPLRSITHTLGTQMRTVLSREPEASRCPDGEKFTQVTASLWPVKR